MIRHTQRAVLLRHVYNIARGYALRFTLLDVAARLRRFCFAADVAATLFRHCHVAAMTMIISFHVIYAVCRLIGFITPCRHGAAAMLFMRYAIALLPRCRLRAMLMPPLTCSRLMFCHVYCYATPAPPADTLLPHAASAVFHDFRC